jgi:hypothetical protein
MTSACGTYDITPTRSAGSLARALVDLLGEQGRDWRDPRLDAHTKRLAATL